MVERRQQLISVLVERERERFLFDGNVREFRFTQVYWIYWDEPRDSGQEDISCLPTAPTFHTIRPLSLSSLVRVAFQPPRHTPSLSLSSDNQTKEREREREKREGCLPLLASRAFIKIASLIYAWPIGGDWRRRGEFSTRFKANLISTRWKGERECRLSTAEVRSSRSRSSWRFNLEQRLSPVCFGSLIDFNVFRIEKVRDEGMRWLFMSLILLDPWSLLDIYDDVVDIWYPSMCQGRYSIINVMCTN